MFFLLVCLELYICLTIYTWLAIIKVYVCIVIYLSFSNSLKVFFNGEFISTYNDSKRFNMLIFSNLYIKNMLYKYNTFYMTVDFCQIMPNLGINNALKQTIFLMLILLSPVWIIIYWLNFNFLLSELIYILLLNKKVKITFKDPFEDLDSLSSLLKLIFYKLPQKNIRIFFYKSYYIAKEDTMRDLDFLLTRISSTYPFWIFFYLYDYTFAIYEGIITSDLCYKNKTRWHKILIKNVKRSYIIILSRNNKPDYLVMSNCTIYISRKGCYVTP